MGNITEAEFTDTVCEAYAATPDARLREVITAVVRQSHALIRELRITESEWLRAILYVTAVGQKCDGKRQEMILLSDTLGISALVNMISANVPAGATESTVIGPFYVAGTPERAYGESMHLSSTSAPSLVVYGSVRSVSGQGIPDATLEFWQTDSNGMYDIQDPAQPLNNLRGTYRTQAGGEYRMVTVRPTSYPIPTDGPVGALLRNTARHPWRPAHLHAMVRAPGYQPLTTHVFDSQDPYLDSDVVFAVKGSLIRRFGRNESSEKAKVLGVSAPFWELEHDFLVTPV